MRYNVGMKWCVGAIGHVLQPEIPLNFLNKIQKVAYRINPFVYEVAKTLDEKGHKLGKASNLYLAT